MKIIDNKGRVFGKINVIDLMIIGFIVLFVAIAIKFFFFRNNVYVDRTIELEINTGEEWQFNAFSIGNVKEDSHNKVIAEIVNKTIKPIDMVVVNDEGEVFLVENPKNKYVVLTIKLIANEVKESLFYDKQKLKVGNTFTLDLNNVEMTGTITNIN